MVRIRRWIFLAILLFVGALIQRGILQVRLFGYSEANSKQNPPATQQINKNLIVPKLNLTNPNAPKPSTSVSREKVRENLELGDPPQQEVFCLLQKTAPKITLGGDIKIVSRKYGADKDSPGMSVLVYSSQCPKNTYSVINFNKNEEVEMEMDCHKTSLEELAKETSLQWNVDENVADFGAFNFAISGSGQFLVYCPKEGFFLTRRGHFEFDNGMLRDVHGCYLWQNGDEINPRGGPITLKTPLDELSTNGCFKRSKQCVAMADLGDPIVRGFSYLDSTLFAVDIEGVILRQQLAATYSQML